MKNEKSQTDQDHQSSTKISNRHLDRLAVVYVRQSTPQQVLENCQSTDMQYALIKKATAFGWPEDRTIVIDEDQGKSGQSAVDRSGFQRLLAEIGLDHIGIIFGLEISRFARSCKDWHQLLELCSIFHTLISDQDGFYDPTLYNDRLLLGLKGTLSEAEIHILQGRLHEGRWNKARKGELFNHAPLGYIRNPNGEMVIDPDKQVQTTVKLVFEKFEELRSINQLLQYLVKNGIKMGIRPHSGKNRGNIEWRRPNRPTLQNMLKHPIYAGAYRYGHRPTDPRSKIPGRQYTGRKIVNYESCGVLIKGQCPSYISWNKFVQNQEQLSENRMRAKSMGTPRKGLALLGGIIFCGRCNRKMSVSYPAKGKPTKFRYCCTRNYIDYGTPICQSFCGSSLDKLVAEELMDVLKPASIELSLATCQTLEKEQNRLCKLWQQRLERSAYEADKAARHYYSVDPTNRLVASNLEGEWEEKLLDQKKVKEEYERFLNSEVSTISDSDRVNIKSLSSDIPELWASATTTNRDRQEITRTIIEKIVVKVIGETEVVEVFIQWFGKQWTKKEIRRPVAKYEQLKDYEILLDRIESLYEEGTSIKDIANKINDEGWKPPKRSEKFGPSMISTLISRRRKISKRPKIKENQNILNENEWWLDDLSRKLKMPQPTLYRWVKRGWIGYRQLTGANGRLILWASPEELTRLGRIRTRHQGWADQPAPANLITPVCHSRYLH